MANDPATERVSAPATPPEVIMPRHKTVERQGAKSEPYVHHYPEVRGGVCEFCGVIDPNVSAEHQYKLCPHYRGQQLRCSYCDENKDPNEVAGRSVLKVTDHPTNPNSLVVVCDRFECLNRHQQRFKVNVLVSSQN